MSKTTLLIIFLLVVRMNAAQFYAKIFKSYPEFKVNQIVDKRFDVDLYFQTIDSLLRLNPNLMRKEEVGRSFKNKRIYLFKIGEGRKKILLWSQMHGDESTASLALLDIFNFFIKDRVEFRKEVKKILSNCTLYFIPILNPDGTKRFERRNAQEIDINRDALALQTPEAKILKSIRDKIKPDFAFNLHDQTALNSVGRTGKIASIAFLAPAYNYEKEINKVRRRAIQIIIEMNKVLQKFYPGNVARYSDDFEPRAFGDNMQKWNTSTILIESGGYFGNDEKAEVRKMNFIALLEAFISISKNNYIKNKTAEYFSIPENEKLIFHLLIKNCKVIKDSLEYRVDLGINYNERYDSLFKNYIKHYRVEDLGDLSTYCAYDTLDVKGNRLNIGKTYPQIFNSFASLVELDYKNLLMNGFTNIVYQGELESITNLNRCLLSMICSTKETLRESQKLLGHTANFFFTTENNELKYVVSNGKVIFKEGRFLY